jgi:hypothetical protein
MKYVFISLAALALIGFVSLTDRETNDYGRKPVLSADETPIKTSLEGKTQEEKADIKSTEMAKIAPQSYSKDGIQVEIMSIEKVEGGVSVYARAWDDGIPIGFVDGTVEIEHFVIYNPPILVSDPNGTYEKVYIDSSGAKHSFFYREDLEEALKQVLTQIIKVSGTPGSNVVPGKTGNTTSTFFPSAGTVEPVDGFIRRNDVTETWAAIQVATGNNAIASDPTWAAGIRGSATTDRWRQIIRSITGFDTSAIGIDTISSATLSAYGSHKDNPTTFGLSMVIDHTIPASTSNLENADFDVSGWDSVRQSDTAISFNSWSTSGYNDFPINATGIAKINKTGLTWFGWRADKDLDNSEPTWSNTEVNAGAHAADATGTSQDPMLVVVHEEPVANFPKPPSLLLLESD